LYHWLLHRLWRWLDSLLGRLPRLWFDGPSGITQLAQFRLADGFIHQGEGYAAGHDAHQSDDQFGAHVFVSPG